MNEQEAVLAVARALNSTLKLVHKDIGKRSREVFVEAIAGPDYNKDNSDCPDPAIEDSDS